MLVARRVKAWGYQIKTHFLGLKPEDAWYAKAYWDDRFAWWLLPPLNANPGLAAWVPKATGSACDFGISMLDCVGSIRHVMHRLYDYPAAEGLKPHLRCG